MKLLIISESPLIKIGAKYYGVDSWIRIPKNFAQHCDVTLLQPTVVYNEGTLPPSDSWHIDIGKMKIEHHDNCVRYIDYYKMLPAHYFKWRKRIDSLIEKHDAVVLRSPSPMVSLVTNIARRRNKPVILFILGDVATQSDRFITSKGLKRALYSAFIKAVLFEERSAAKSSALIYAYNKDIANRLKGCESRVKLAQDPLVSLADFIKRDDTCQSNEIRLLRICWLLPSKGIEDLLDAVGILRKKGVFVKLDIVGQERTEKGYLASLKQRAERLGIGNYVNFAGWVPFDRLSDVYLKSDIHVISSHAEGTPRCIIEGFARGVPLVCTSVGGCKETLVHEQDALLVEPRNPQSLACGIERMILQKDLRKKLISRGYELAKQASFETAGINFIKEIKETLAEWKSYGME